MEKNFYIIIAVVIIIIAGAWFLMSGNLRQAGGVKVENNSAIESAAKEVVLTIDNGGGSQNNFTFELKDGMTAFDLLKAGAEKSALLLKIKNYDMGVFVEAIGNTENGQDGKYWMYYVNGAMPDVASDKKELKPGDKVEFKFEKSPY